MSDRLHGTGHHSQDACEQPVRPRCVCCNREISVGYRRDGLGRIWAFACFRNQLAAGAPTAGPRPNPA